MKPGDRAGKAAGPGGLSTDPIARDLEKAFASDPGFGDSGYIRDRLRHSYLRRLERIAAETPAAARLHRELADTDIAKCDLFDDPVLRCAIQHAFARIANGSARGLPLEQCTALLDSIRDTGARPTRRGAQPLRAADFGGAVWREDAPDDAFGHAFRLLVRNEYEGSLCTPSDAETAVLEDAVRLLGELLPMLARSALSHTHLIAVFPPEGAWKGKASSSQFQLSGVIFLNRAKLRNPWWTAEHLLHESLHQKLYDIRRGHALLRPGAGAARIRSLWNTPGTGEHNLWNTDRALAAFHVYVQLALFARVAERSPAALDRTYGPRTAAPRMIDTGRALARAHYLGEQLQDRQDLGPAGTVMVEWLLALLDEMDPAPPPPGSFVHLLLDRYRKEARLTGRAGPAGGTGHLTDLAIEELDVARHILAALPGADGGPSIQVRWPAGELGGHFREVREHIAGTLADACADGFTLAGPSSRADGLARMMIERSSRRLGALPAR
ncbi:MAG TPA: HEXXH motif-containing putative peptide modification protein [Spirillospora sp.]|nr:HEXXH motif-containing putative peptide modification protein [Spirillospora sp.]